LCGFIFFVRLLVKPELPVVPAKNIAPWARNRLVFLVPTLVTRKVDCFAELFPAKRAIVRGLLTVHLFHVLDQAWARAQRANAVWARKLVRSHTLMARPVLRQILGCRKGLRTNGAFVVFHIRMRPHMLTEHRFRLARVRAHITRKHSVTFLVLFVKRARRKAHIAHITPPRSVRGCLMRDARVHVIENRIAVKACALGLVHGGYEEDGRKQGEK